VIYTVGHSTLPPQQFLGILVPDRITTVIDVRSHPGSSYVPVYGQEQMRRWLTADHIGYEWWPDLGGWAEQDADQAERLCPYGVDVTAYTHGAFPKGRIAKKVGDGTNPRCPKHGGARRDGECTCAQRRDPLWQNYGFYDYSFFMAQPRFLQAAQFLVQRGQQQDVAIMCAEAVWWRCHRAMIADWLAFTGVPATHLQPHRAEHQVRDRLGRYEPEILEIWRSTAAKPS
jgi:uncharacterized protein (DUF488 family)